MKYTLLFLLSAFYTLLTLAVITVGDDDDGYVPDGFSKKLAWKTELQVWEFIPVCISIHR